MNSANLLTFGRLLLTVLFFALIALFHYQPTLLSAGEAGISQFLRTGSYVLLLVALGSDVLDGFVARKMGVESDMGRILDPLVDKILICGALVMFLGFYSQQSASLLSEWMVVVVITREFVVQGIRTNMEKRGIDFPALLWGKIKMGAQALCVVSLFTYGLLFRAAWFYTFNRILVWGMIICTLLSGMIYVYHATRLTREKKYDRANA